MLSIHDPLLIFTDLDGTLLNSHTFEWQPAAPWLTRLHESGVPVILCSSKTAAEMLQLQTTLNLQGLPLIAGKRRGDHWTFIGKTIPTIPV
ncbi:mannosyl-3-phosphoglycerate phosphatase [Salmonella enterica subsp. enterica serovar Madelia]|nr:mannosyl-3-phosphoglycerate phosphatase [Salmonella enterica subsp. enterica serovar Madelia]